MVSVLNSQIPTTKSRLDGIITTKDNIQQEILKLLKNKPCTPTHLANHFHKSREQFSRSYIYPMIQSGLVEKVDGTNYYQLPKQKNSSKSIKEALRSSYEIFQTELFVNWKKKNHSKDEEDKRVRFANICMGFTNKNFSIHPDNINKENWKEVVTNMVDATLQVATYELVNNEPNWSTRQAIRHAIKYGLGIEISETEGIELRISGTKPTPKIADLHITSEQIILAKELLKKKSDIEWFLKFGIKTWTFVRPSTIYLIELIHMEFLDQIVEYVLGKDGKKITDEKIIEYAKFRGDEVFSYARRICHIDVHENKTDSDFDKYILDPDFVEPLEKFYNMRKSQRKKYLFWEYDNTKFTFGNYNTIVKVEVGKDNKFFKKILTNIGFEKSNFGLYFRANYGFRHFGIQMWLLATDYNYDLVAEMSHEDTATLKKWYGKRTKEDFQRKIKGVMII